jgi:hypothetical protein
MYFESTLFSWRSFVGKRKDLTPYTYYLRDGGTLCLLIGPKISPSCVAKVNPRPPTHHALDASDG